MQFIPLAKALGAEVVDIDLTKELDTISKGTLKSGLLEHQVIYFRDQNITSKQQLDLAEVFGEAVIHPAYHQDKEVPEVNILINDKDRPSKIELWHTDMTFMKCPPLGSILRAEKIPDFGGDTLFASMSAAFEGLSDKMQSFLSGLTAIHDFSYGFKESLAEPGGKERLKQAVIDNPPVEHPVIRTHPLSKKKGLFVNCLFTKNIVGLKQKESDTLLKMLYSHMVLPEYTFRLKWEKDSIAFWDNRITQHKPINDYFPKYREMHRITIKGDKPFY
jgi:taurine dioxygenase